MQRGEFDRIEATLGVRLPADYRAALLDRPLPADADSADLWLVDDADQVIAMTQEFRSAARTGRPWPAHYLYLGGDGGEQAYFLDLSSAPATVCAYDYESTEVSAEAPDLPTWLTSLRREHAAITEDERALNERHRTRRWWQFWVRPYPSRPAT